MKCDEDRCSESTFSWLDSFARNRRNDTQGDRCHPGNFGTDIRGTIRDQQRNFELCLKSAETGDIQAQVNVAESYRCGIEGVVTKDMEEAFKWFRRAAGEESEDVEDQIDSPALFFKGFLKRFGIQDSCSRLKIDVLKKLNKYYMIGECPEGKPQPIKALYYLKKAAELGDSEAQKDLGLAYLKGESGQPKDLNKATRWLKKAASNGDQEANEMIKKFDDKNIVEIAEEQKSSEFLEGSAKQYFELLDTILKESQKRHPYVKGPTVFGVKCFERFPKSPIAQHYKKAMELLMRGLDKLGNWAKTDEKLSTDSVDFEEGIKMLAQGMMFENSVVESHLQNVSKPARIHLIRDSIFKKLKTNPNFFEGLVVLFATYPLQRRFGAESCRMDLRRTMFLNNIIHLIKKAEPNMPPTQDPYSYDQNYSSWLHRLHYFLGSNYIIAHCFKDGAEVFQNALDCCPKFAEAKLPLGSCFLSMRSIQPGDRCDKNNQEVKLNPEELLLERFAKPEYQRITKGDYRTWSVTQLREKARQLFMEYLTEVPECDKKYPEGHYHLAYLSFIEGKMEEALRWKEEGEEAEEKRLPFLLPLDSAMKGSLMPLDLLPISKKHRQKTGHVPSDSGGPCPTVARQQVSASGKTDGREGNTCVNCEKSNQELKWCPCKKVCYCGSECQKEDWKKHKTICTWKKKGKKYK